MRQTDEVTSALLELLSQLKMYITNVESGLIDSSWVFLNQSRFKKMEFKILKKGFSVRERFHTVQAILAPNPWIQPFIKSPASNRVELGSSIIPHLTYYNAYYLSLVLKAKSNSS